MGNKISRKRHAVDERYTKPQRHYVHKDVDQKKLRKLILKSKLAPCFPGDEDSRLEHEECPICFLYYPSLNRSRCCMKSICTECFLQMKNPNSTRPTQCPFCKTFNYAVEYKGVKTKEEKGLEQIEEQRVIEAKIRIRQQEMLDDEEKLLQKLEPNTLPLTLFQQGVECSASASTCHRSVLDTEEAIPPQRSYKRPAYSAAGREDELDLDLEDIMVMEAIWLSIQENGKQRMGTCSEPISAEEYALGHYAAPEMASSSSSSASPTGLACALVALAERQRMSGESSLLSDAHVFSDHMYSGNRNFYHGLDQDPSCYISTSDSCHSVAGWRPTCSSDGSDSIPTYPCADSIDHSSGGMNGSFLHMAEPIVPQTYEEEMMLAMAVSLADARARSGDWQ